jgi:hypothetical protein
MGTGNSSLPDPGTISLTITIYPVEKGMSSQDREDICCWFLRGGGKMYKLVKKEKNILSLLYILIREDLGSPTSTVLP